jgi:hypothetical protein
MKDKIKLIDRSFSHSKLGFCSDYQESSDFYWDRQNVDINGVEPIVFTDLTLNNAVKKEISYAWLIEPIAISPQNYDLIKKISNNFNTIFTHERSLLELGKPYEFLPFGCCWIKPEDHKIFNKTKNISIISSDKKMTDGHILRHKIIDTYRNFMDVYGRGYNPIEYKLDGLKDYRFSIVIENCKRDYWFTEKLIDCLITGTIPIYWGCPSIGDFFDIEGFIIIDEVNDLTSIIENLNEELYISKSEYILNNFHKSKKYISPDNLIYNKIKKYE